MSSRTLIHLCLTAIFALAVLWVMGAWGRWSEEGAIMNQLLAILVLAVSGGFFMVVVLLPRFGEAVGTAMLSSGEEVQPDAGSRAVALIARGDYEGAVAEYEKLIGEKPEDPQPIAEAAKLCADKLQDPQRGLQLLRTHFEGREWSEDDTAFLLFRMVDIHLKQQAYDEAKGLLEQIAGRFPGTRHSANARHKIHEVEQAQFKALQAQRAQDGAHA